MSDQTSQIINAPVVGNVSGGVVRVSNTTIHNHHQHTHYHQHSHHGFALQAPPAPPARRTKAPKVQHNLSPGQKDLLALMRPLPADVRVQVLDFMRAEYGTGLVMELTPRDVHTTRKHVLDIRRSLGITA